MLLSKVSHLSDIAFDDIWPKPDSALKALSYNQVKLDKKLC